VIEEKWRLIGMDGGHQLRIGFSFLDSGGTEEEEEEEEEEVVVVVVVVVVVIVVFL